MSCDFLPRPWHTWDATREAPGRRTAKWGGNEGDGDGGHEYQCHLDVTDIERRAAVVSGASHMGHFYHGRRHS